MACIYDICTLAHKSTHTRMQMQTHAGAHAVTLQPACAYLLQDGEDPKDALNCRSLSAKEPLIIGPFPGKLPTKIRHRRHLRHSVQIYLQFCTILCIRSTILCKILCIYFCAQFWACTTILCVYSSIFYISVHISHDFDPAHPLTHGTHARTEPQPHITCCTHNATP